MSAVVWECVIEEVTPDSVCVTMFDVCGDTKPEWSEIKREKFTEQEKLEEGAVFYWIAVGTVSVFAWPEDRQLTEEEREEIETRAHEMLRKWGFRPSYEEIES